MTERPIIFSAPMVRAILAGEKSQTRRIVKPQPEITGEHPQWRDEKLPLWRRRDQFERDCCPYGSVGDLLWVREAWRTGDQLGAHSGSKIQAMAEECGYYKHGGLNPCCPIYYEADGHHRAWGDNDEADFGVLGRYRHGRFMPRWASRITLEITGIRVERLNDITEADARAEGCVAHDSARREFAHLWSTIHAADGPNGWEANPWVWVIEFKRVKEAK